MSKKEKIKTPKTKLQKTRTILFIFAILATVVLFVYAIACAAPILIVFPILIFFLFVVLIPTVFTIGIIWTSEGYRNFISGLGDTMLKIINSSQDAVLALKTSLPYGLSITMVLVASYLAISIISFVKDKTGPGCKKHLIFSIILSSLSVLFLIISIVLFQKI